MQPVRAIHQPAAASPAHTPITYPSSIAPMLPAHPQREGYTGDEIPCTIQGINPQDGSYVRVRDMFTSSPTSGTTLPRTLLPRSREEVEVPPHSSASWFPFEAGASSITPCRRESQRLSQSRCAEEGLIVNWPIPHPYARLYNKKNSPWRRRKMWNHAFEKFIFTPQEINAMTAPDRRTIYHASLEAHIDRLHEQLLSFSMAAVPFEKLAPYHGLNDQTVKSMVAGLQHDTTEIKLKLLELERANATLEQALSNL